MADTPLADRITELEADIDRGSSSSARVRMAIINARDFYAADRLGFNNSTIYTTANPGLNQYCPANWIETDSIQIWTDFSRKELVEEAVGTINDMQRSGTPVTGIPSHFCTEHRKVRFHPAPDVSYTIRWSMLLDFPEISKSAVGTTTSYWLDEGWALIKSRAMRELLVFYVGGPEAAQQSAILKEFEDDIFDGMVKQAQREETAGKVRGTI